MSRGVRTEAAGPASVVGYRHEALLYEGEDGFVEAVAPFLAEGVDRHEAVLVVVPAAKAARLQAELGPMAAGVGFADMDEVGTNPGRLLATWQAFIDGHLDAPALRGVGEPVYPGRSPEELRACELHEQLLNLGITPPRPFWLRCLYDLAGLGGVGEALAERTHPNLTRRGRFVPSPAYWPLDATSALTAPLRPRPAAAQPLPFDADRLAVVRRQLLSRAATAGLCRSRLEDLELAVQELMVNSVRHGGGRGKVATWVEDGAFLVEVADTGRLSDPLVGCLPPAPQCPGGRGLYLVNQLTDLVQIHVDEAGTRVRVQVRLDPVAPPR